MVIFRPFLFHDYIANYYIKGTSKIYNSRYILNIKLKKLDQYNIARQKVAAYYNEAFASIKEIITPSQANYSSHVYHQYTLQLKGVNRASMMEHLAAKDIPCMIYYPVPGHLQKMFGEQKNNHWHLPITDSLTPCVFSLPIHTEMDETQLAYIVEGVKSFFN